MASGDRLPANFTADAKRANGTVTSLLGEAGLAVATSDDPRFADKAGRIAGVRSVINDVSFQAFDGQHERAVALPASHGGYYSENAYSNPFLPFQWGLTAVQAPAAWNAGAQGQGVVVADLDTGFDLTHPDLQPNVIGSVSFVTLPGEDQDAQHRSPSYSHGTHTAGTIAAANNNLGVIGVAPKAKLLLVKVLSDAGQGSFSWLMNGIVYAADHGADVINMSLMAALPRNGKYLDEQGRVINNTKATQELVVALNKATGYARKRGVTLVASVGNDGNDGNKDQSWIRIPADATGVIAIAATGPVGWGKATQTTNLDRFASYSNFGTPAVMFAAPGGDFSYPDFSETTTMFGYYMPTYAMDMVLSTDKDGSYSWLAGTSMAAPHASGIAALVIGQHGGQLDPARVEAILRASADDLGKPGRDPYYGYGRLNAYRAVSQARYATR
ncbi:S8 family serine peptidase [Hymenobacter sp. BT683]|uniref:S8 family serine peptidase n=1 Tax=Hymenobacter jeongseonensis TaxID=2791027 RepID=A0ABS0IJR2_9BACT|nr:S8 family serine peptidase [Hymenobacter jeongseonensis]